MIPWFTAKQLSDWFEWMRKYHVLPDRNDIMFGSLISLIHNQWCDPSDRLRPIDCMPYHDKYEDLTVEDMKARLHLP